MPCHSPAVKYRLQLLYSADHYSKSGMCGPLVFYFKALENFQDLEQNPDLPRLDEMRDCKHNTKDNTYSSNNNVGNAQERISSSHDGSS